MYVVINGGGKLGSYLARTLFSKGHHVAIIEKRPQVLEKLSEELPDRVLLIEGDGCDIEFQEDAGVGHADVFASVTGHDEDNLVACQLAKIRFKINRAVARINSPKNENIFKALGIEGISSTTIISRLIEEEMTIGDISTLYMLEKSRLVLVKIDLPEDRCAVCGKRISELNLTRDTILVTLIRGDRVVVPKGDTVMDTGDRVIALTSLEHKEELRRILQGN
jgi:trk system potassium uptake protein TrkA